MNHKAPSEADSSLPDDLPPVKPPSVGFIVQLFVVPGLIVAAIVGIWLLFGRLATAEQDWHRQLVELQNPNEHRRWRGAMGLSQMLRADQDLGESSQHLAENPELVKGIGDLLGAELERNGQREEDFQFQAFLARTLGLFDVPENLLPVLRQALRPGVDREVRKNALGSIAVMVDRLNRRHEPYPAELLSTEVIQSSADEDPLIRQLSAYTLGLFDTPASRSRLQVLLGDSNNDVRVNAAIALARRNDRSGVPVFREILANADRAVEKGSSDEFAQFLSVRNSLTALHQLTPLLTDTEKAELSQTIRPIAENYREPEIRVAAQSTLQTLSGRK